MEAGDQEATVNAETWQAWITGVAAVGAGAAFFYGLRGVARGRLRELENIYFERYWKIIDRLDRQALVGDKPATSIACRRRRCQGRQPAGSEPDEETRKTCVLYLRLCEDELRLRQSGLVSDGTWKLWTKGMRLQIAKWPVREEWLAIESSTTDRFKLLRHYCPQGNWKETVDPMAINPILARWRGARRTNGARRRANNRRKKHGLSD